MKLKKEFGDFYEQIKIHSEANSLKEKREILQDDIMNNLPDSLEDHGIDISKSDIRMIDQGSYKYKTTIKSDIVDRDVAVMIPLDTSKHKDPRAIKKYLYDAINIQSRTVTVKEPCVRASYFKDGKEILHIDLPLYALDDNGYFLARGKLGNPNYSWQEADPDGLNHYICNKISQSEQLRRIICFIKKWRNVKYANSDNDHEVPPSIGLTLLACQCFVPQTTNDEDNDLLAFQKTMKAIMNKFSISRDAYGNVIKADINCYLPVKPYSDVFQKMRDRSSEYILTFYKRLSKAVDNLTDAVNVESAHDAGIYVQKVLGDEFVVPEKEAIAAVTQNRREHSFG